MRILTIIAGIILLLGVASCNRYDNGWPTQTNDDDEITFTQYVAQIDTTMEEGLAAGDVAAVMTLYHPDYLNAGAAYDDMQTFFTGLTQMENLVPAVETTLESETSMTLTYRIYDASGVTGVDTTFTDVAMETENGFILWGDREGGPVEITTRVLAEVATARWCPNCPDSGHELASLAAANPGRMIYIEYIQDDGPEDNSDIFTYYSDPDGNSFDSQLPCVIFQGQRRVTGAGQGPLDTYTTFVDFFLSQEAHLDFANLDYTLDGLTISGTFDVYSDGSIEDTTGLTMKLVLMEEETQWTYYIGNEPIHHGVLDKTQIGLDSADQTVSFELTSIDPVPEDLKLIVWVQTLNEPYNEQTSIVHNVQSYSITTR